MAIPEQTAPEERQKKTQWLLAAGAASLLIPLIGAIYLHWSQNAGAPGPSGRGDIFERRDGTDRKITPTQTAVMTSPSALTAPPPSGMVAGVSDKPTGSSLDFIKSNPDLRAQLADAKAAGAGASAASTAATAMAAPAGPAAAAAKTDGAKAFAVPKLKPSSFSNFGSNGPGGSNAGSGSGQNMQDVLKNLPPGAANDPRIQAYLQSQQQGQ